MSSRQELSYDCEDFMLSEDCLKLKYAFTGEHPEYSSIKWIQEPYDYQNPMTYWEWVMQSIERDAKNAYLYSNQGTLPL